VAGETGTLYVANASGTVAVVDGRRCNAADTSRCNAPPTTVRVGSNPQFLAVDEKTHTVYVANSGADTVSVLDTRVCSARRRAGCKVVATVKAGALPFTLAVNDLTGTSEVAPQTPVGISPRRVVVDEATNTVYVTNAGSNSVAMLNGRTCNGRVRSGCERVPVAPGAGTAT